MTVYAHWGRLKFNLSEGSRSFTVTGAAFNLLYIPAVRQSPSAVRKASSLEQELFTMKHSIWEEQKWKPSQSRQLNAHSSTKVYYLRTLSIHLLPAALMGTSIVSTVRKHRWGSRREMSKWPHDKAWSYSQQSQRRYNGRSCRSSITSVLVHGLFDPLLHVVDFQGTSLLHGFGVQRVVAAQVQVMGSIWDHNCHKGISDILGHPPCRPRVQATVAVGKKTSLGYICTAVSSGAAAHINISTETDLSPVSMSCAHPSAARSLLDRGRELWAAKQGYASVINYLLTLIIMPQPLEIDLLPPVTVIKGSRSPVWRHVQIPKSQHSALLSSFMGFHKPITSWTL